MACNLLILQGQVIRRLAEKDADLPKADIIFAVSSSSFPDMRKIVSLS
jgi:hypothetical protein